MRPSYLELDNKSFQQKISRAKKQLSMCSLCPHKCNVNRIKEEKGFCCAGQDLEVSHWQVHFGEEPPLSKKSGAGAIFFAHCNMKCVYCQNYQISQQPNRKKTISSEELCDIMLELKKQGAQNIDLVSPTHFAPHIIEAVYIARNKGLDLPIVYNSNGYENLDTLELLSGIVDIYLPDFKYADQDIASKYSQVTDYENIATQAIVEMYKQVQDLMLDKNGCAQRGLFVRHLVLPHRLAGSFSVLDILKKKTSVNIGLSLMSQYTPHYRAGQFNQLDRTLQIGEYNEVVEYVQKLDFKQCWIQELNSSSVYLPNFENSVVFPES